PPPGTTSRRLLGFLTAAAVVLAALTVLPAQDFAPPPGKAPDADTLKKITQKISSLRKKIDSLRKRQAVEPWLDQAEVYLRAAVSIVRHNEFFQKEAADWTLDALDRGLFRAAQIESGESPPPWLNLAGQSVVRGYRSRIDETVQPYAVTFPHNYEPKKKKWRL